MHSKAKAVMKHTQIIILLLIFGFSQISTNLFAQNEKSDFQIRKVVIDAGHGGKDPGAVGQISYEKDITLKLALKLGGYINEHLPDIEVVYTRDTDVFIELYKRAQIANKAKADLFISIHINAAGSPNAVGTETFAMGLHKTESNLAVAKKENSVIMFEENYEDNYEGFDPTSPESHIMFSMYQNAYLGQSLNLAGLMQDQFTNRVGRYNRGVKQAGFWVLHAVAMPSILIEAGFISNPEEEKYLNTEEGITYMASAMFRAFRDYKKAFEADNLVAGEDALELIENKEETETGGDSKDNTNENGEINIAFPSDDTKNAEIIFRVQIGASSESCENINIKYSEITDAWEYFHMGLYKHTAGKSSNYQEIINLQNKLRGQYPDCFVVAFKNNNRITIRDALNELGN
ncbi:MAG: N-acetylmuramoyl-L-alanine amidase [Bacteroidota bacterium]|nr:N-acetylmuramoyl-L-alanine amidase [Bacteroidota bacterium]